MAGGATAQGPISRADRLRGNIGLVMCCVPLPVMAAGLAGAAHIAPLPDLADRFNAAPGVMPAAFALAAAYVVVLVRLVERYRVASGGTIWGEAPRGIRSFGGVVMIAIAIWPVTAIAIGQGLADLANTLLGTVSYETGIIQRKWTSQGRGCHFHVQAYGPTVESGTQFCLDEARWKGVAVDDALPLAVLRGPLGWQSAVVPASRAAKKDRGHD